jgi:hypothetical protein
MLLTRRVIHKAAFLVLRGARAGKLSSFFRGGRAKDNPHDGNSDPSTSPCTPSFLSPSLAVDLVKNTVEAGARYS